jgi:thiamine biosynthesis protein ThiI
VVLLVRYGELSLKSPYVRRQLEDRLVANVQAMFAANGAECVVRRERGRLFVHAEDEDAALRLLRRVFGIVSISPAEETSSDLDELTPFFVNHAKGILTPGASFAVRARRSGEHPYTSQELARVLGAAVQRSIPGLAVNLDAPQREIHVEVRGPRAYVFHDVVPGTGGMPLRSQGPVLVLARDDEGMAATWLMMRRGCGVVVAGGEPQVTALRRWDPRLETAAAEGPSDLIRIAEARGVLGIALSTHDASDIHGGRGDGVMVLQPLAGLSDDEVAQIVRSIRGT